MTRADGTGGGWGLGAERAEERAREERNLDDPQQRGREEEVERVRGERGQRRELRRGEEWERRRRRRRPS